MKILFLFVLVALVGVISINEAFAVAYKDDTGYLPKWAESLDNAHALNFCGNITTPGQDMNWCNDFGVFVNQQLKSQVVSSKTSNVIPGWIKSLAGFWADGEVSDSEFVRAIEHLIKNKIIVIPPMTQTIPNAGDSKIPDWVRNNAKWWSQNQISDDDFVNGIEFLGKSGIIITQMTIKNPHPKEFLATASEIGDGWKETGYSCKDCTMDDPDPNQKHWADIWFKKDTSTIIVGDIEFKTKDFAKKDFDLFLDDSYSDVMILTKGDTECKKSIPNPDNVLSLNVFKCHDGRYIFSIISIGKNEVEYRVMDKMLEKYYKKIGREQNISTQELAKTPYKIIPGREPTHEEIISSLFVVDKIDCKDSGSGNYVEWSGSITSYASDPLDVIVILTGEDINGEIVTFEKEYVFDIYPEQTKFMTGLLDDVPGFDSCGYRIESVQ